MIKAFMPLLTMHFIRMSKKFEGLCESDAEIDQCNSEGLGAFENWKTCTEYCLYSQAQTGCVTSLCKTTPNRCVCLLCPAGVVKAQF